MSSVILLCWASAATVSGLFQDDDEPEDGGSHGDDGEVTGNKVFWLVSSC